MNKPTKPNIVIPESFAENGIKTDFDNEKLTNGFDRLQPDVLAGDNLNKFIDDTYKGLNYGMAAADAINLINEGETLTVVDGKLTSGAIGSGLELCDTDIVIRDDEKMFNQLQQMRRSTFDPSKFTVVGSPTITDDGVASGFNHSNYVNAKVSFNQNNKVRFKISGIYTESTSAQSLFSFYSTRLELESSSCSFKWNNIWIIGTSFPEQIKTGDIVAIDLILDNVGGHKLKVYKNGILIGDAVSNTQTSEANIVNLRVGDYQQLDTFYFQGSIDLKHFSITVDGKEVFSGNKTGIDTVKINNTNIEIPYTFSKTGSKIVDGVYRDRVIDLYEQEGQAGYYTIDEENKNFTLPMGEIYGMIEQKGTYQPPLLSTMWSDHLLNDMSWLRADTFSWQDGNTYSLVYNELLSEYNNSASTTETYGSITFKRTPKGYKIALATQETAILNKYNTDGIAWYYILDTTNKKFKLPRTKFGFEGLRTSVADDIEAGLPNISGVVSSDIGSGATGAFEWTRTGATKNGGPTSFGKTTFNASRSNPIYGNSDTVQPPATQMYLYFYVGAFTKSAEAQTAGLNSELLNGKADVDTPSIQAPYLKDTYVNGTSWYRVWSDGWCEQGGVFTNTSNKQSVTLLQNYINTNYNVQMTIFNTMEGASTSNIKVNSKSTSLFEVWVEKEERPIMWRACGYIS